MKLPQPSQMLLRQETVKITRDITGGVRLEIGGMGMTMAPQEAVKFATILLQAAGCNVTTENGPLAPARMA